MKNTENYNLPLFESGDKFNKETINEANSKIDLAISDLQETFNIGSVGSGLVTQEVVNARKGKGSLKEKIDEIDTKQEDIFINKIPNIQAQIDSGVASNIRNITNSIEIERFYKVATFGIKIPNGVYDLYIKVTDGVTEQYVEVKCVFANSIENISCKSPFLYSYSVVGLGKYRLIKKIRLMKDKSGEIFIAIQSNVNKSITGVTRIGSYNKENILTPIFEKYTGENIDFTFTNHFSQDYADIGTGFQNHSAINFENTLTLKDNIVIYDDIMIYPENETKYSSLRISNGSVLIENDGTYIPSLGYYHYNKNAKFRIMCDDTNKQFYFQVGKGDKTQEDDENCRGKLNITGWLNKNLEQLTLNTDLLAINKGDVRLDGRGHTSPSVIYFFEDGGSGNIGLNRTSGVMDINAPNGVNVNGRTVITAQSCTSTTRPTGCMQGFSIYDRQIGKPIWWSGTSWVDSSGTVV